MGPFYAESYLTVWIHHILLSTHQVGSLLFLLFSSCGTSQCAFSLYPALYGELTDLS